MKRKMTLSIAAALLLSAGCHFFESADDIDECPLNSGWPCPCDNTQLDNGGLCDDRQSTCLWVNDETRGMCSLPCNGVSDTLTCRNTQDYGNEGICRFKTDESETPNFCGIICVGNGSGNCPPGMDCLILDGESYKMCFPRETD